MERLRGTWYVVPTAFGKDGALDLDGQARLVDAAIGWGVDGLTVMGVMSEAPALTDHERGDVLRSIFAACNDRVPVVVGCSGSSAARVIDRMRAAADLGARAAMVSAPPLLKNVDALPAFYERVRSAGGVPVVVQDEPAATGTTVPVSVLLRCLDQARSNTVKLEDPPTPPKLTRLLAERSDLSVFGGLGGVAALSELHRGGCGTMTGFSFPEVLATLRVEIEAGRIDRGAEVFDRYLPLITFEGQMQIGLGIRKEILVRRGVLRSSVTRALTSLDGQTIEELDHLLDRLQIHPASERMKVALP